jgi:hypothetical protein
VQTDSKSVPSLPLPAIDLGFDCPTLNDLFPLNRDVLRRINAQLAALGAVAFEDCDGDVVAYLDGFADFACEYEHENSFSKIMMVPG